MEKIKLCQIDFAFGNKNYSKKYFGLNGYIGTREDMKFPRCWTSGKFHPELGEG